MGGLWDGDLLGFVWGWGVGGEGGLGVMMGGGVVVRGGVAVGFRGK